MRESRPDRFRRVAEARVNKIIKMVRLLEIVPILPYMLLRKSRYSRYLLHCGMNWTERRSDIPGLTRNGFRCRTNSMLPAEISDHRTASAGWKQS